MILKTKAKNLQISRDLYQEISKKLAKIFKLLPNLTNDLTSLSITMEIQRGHFSCSIIFSLPKDVLVAQADDKSLGRAVKSSFDKLIFQVKRYKELHFKSLSRYPKKVSVRRAENEDEKIWARMLN